MFNFRRDWYKQGKTAKDLAFAAPLFPIVPILGFVFCLITCISMVLIHPCESVSSGACCLLQHAIQVIMCFTILSLDAYLKHLRAANAALFIQSMNQNILQQFQTNYGILLCFYTNGIFKRKMPEKCLTHPGIHPNIRPPLKRPYRLEA